MDEIVSNLPIVDVSTDTIVEIDSKLPDAQVDVTKSITVEIQPETYVLTSSGMYTGNMTGSVPSWILNAIQEQLTTGDGNLMSVLDDMKALLGSLQLGVNQTISQIENTNTSMSALETSLSSRIQGNYSAILDVYATRVTHTEAQAIAVQAIGSTFNGNVDAYIGNLASTYTNATSAIATDIHTLQVSYNDQTARIDTVEEVSLSKNATIRSATAPTLITNPLLISGDLWINTTNNVTKSWNGSSWIDITNTNTQQAYTWSATASKLITAPDGSVTGWSFGDGSNTKSNFKIKATNFSISDGTTGYTPFSITGTDIQFNGKVSFSSVTGTPTHTSGLLSARPVSAVLGSTYVATNESNKLYTYTATGWKVGGATSNEVVTDINAGNTTTIDGGKITTGSILSDKIAANISITSPMISGGVVNGTVINGGTINGVNINGAVIKASWIDYSSTGTLTNWAYYTPVTMPAQYATNFAHDSSTGALITDSSGFVRLPKVSKVIIGSFLYNVGSTANVYTLGNVYFAGYDLDIHSFDDYTTTSNRRLLNANTRIVFDSANIPFLTVRGGSGYNGGSVGTCSATWRIGTDVFVYYGLSKATDQGADPHTHTTRLSKNGVYLINTTTTVPSGVTAGAVAYNGDIVSCGITTSIYAAGAYISVVILNAINDTVAYIGTNTTISVGACTAYASENLNAGIKVYVPTGTESY